MKQGKTEISVENLEKISDFFGVTMDQMIKQDLRKEMLIPVEEAKRLNPKLAEILDNQSMKGVG